VGMGIMGMWFGAMSRMRISLFLLDFLLKCFFVVQFLLSPSDRSPVYVKFTEF
jgi:hypothetical protein